MTQQVPPSRDHAFYYKEFLFRVWIILLESFSLFHVKMDGQKQITMKAVSQCCVGHQKGHEQQQEDEEKSNLKDS